MIKHTNNKRVKIDVCMDETVLSPGRAINADNDSKLPIKNEVPLLLLNLAPVYLFLEKFCIFWRKLHYIFCIVCTFMSQKYSTLIVYKTKLMVGVPSLTHIPIDIHLLPWKYMSAREYIFLSHALCVYRYNEEKFVRRKIYSLALVF